jgi:glycerol uptake facilitator-like aquaporin
VFGCGWPWFAPYVFGQLIGGALAGVLFRLRLKLQQLYKEHLEEMASRQTAEGAEGEEMDTPLRDVEPASA